MAEIATIARPYAEALFKAIGPQDATAVSDQVSGLAFVAANAQVREFADNPKVLPQQVFELMISASPLWVGDGAQNLLRTVIDNGRLAALPEIASQFHALVNSRSGISDAVIESAFPIADNQFGDVVASLERRFNRKLKATVVVKPELIGGIRVVVGDEVLDTSVRARLEQMKVALTA